MTIRTLDAGGDKPIAGLTIDGESNPFLGVRGIRLSLSRPEVFRVQLRALARAAVHWALKVMLPMVAVPSELEALAALLDEEIAALTTQRDLLRRPPLGMMVEVPAAALRAEEFDAAFYSIGSNDLTQYTMAAARDIGAVADLNDTVTRRCWRSSRGRWRRDARAVSRYRCAAMRRPNRADEGLLATGLATLSVSPVAVARLKAAIAAVSP